MDTIGEKIRFLACEQIETCLSGLFPTAKVLPFGSSVNSFGKRTCDLDMAVIHENNSQKNINGSKLVFHTKGADSFMQRHTPHLLNYVSYATQNFLPGCRDIVNIFNARVPIVKFNQDFLDLECDLSQCG